MALKQLSPKDQKIIRDCLNSILEGSLIEDWEFHTRLGLTRRELRKVLERWPELDDSLSDSCDAIAINNCLNEVCHGVRMSEEEWKTWFDNSRSEVERVYLDWMKSGG